MGVSAESSQQLTADRFRAVRRANQATPGLYVSRSAAGLPVAPIPRSPSAAGQHESPSVAGRRESPSVAGRRESPSVAGLRELAGAGRLADVAKVAGDAERSALTAAAYEVAWPIVYARLTRKFEQRRGHVVCTLGVDRLADECLDRFHDDVEAVVDDLLTGARQQVRDLEAWIAGRLTAATVNAYRRVRGRRGALQRPRLPGWLAAELGHDRWLSALAVEILVWVGVRTAAGTGLWPLDAWAHQRATVTGDWQDSDPARAGRDVETVLAAMRRHPDWYDSYVERPLGRKQAPVWTGEPATDLSLTEPHQEIDAEMLRLAADAVRVIDHRVAGGEEAEAVVIDVIRAVFGRSVTIAGLDRAPHAVADPVGGLSGALTDPATIDRIVRTVLEIIRRG